MSFMDSLRLLLELGFRHALQFLLTTVIGVRALGFLSIDAVCLSVSVHLKSAVGLCSLHRAHCLVGFMVFWSGDFGFGQLIGQGGRGVAKWVST